MIAFVTGGSGFVGRWLIEALAHRGEVRGLARSEAAAIAVRASGGEPVRGDLDDVAALTEGMRGATVVFHAAAYVKAYGPLAPFIRANVVGTDHVIAAARAAGVARVVHLSSEAVLADGKPIVRADETWPYPAKPCGPYPLTKGQAERAMLAANRDGLTTVVVRPRAIWGRGDTSVLPELIAAVRAGRFRWIGDGRYLTSTCHVANVVEGALLAAERGRGGEVYFVTDGEPLPFRDYITGLLATAGVEIADKSISRTMARAIAAATAWMKRPPVTKTELALAGHEVTVDDGKARRELGYAATMTRQAGLADMVAARE